MGTANGYEHAWYLTAALRPEQARLAVERVIRRIRRMDSVDAIAFRGMSGALIAPAVSIRLGIPLIMVRKEAKTHSAHSVEGYALAKRYVIVDDLVASGKTVIAICEAIEGFAPDARCAGVITYNTARPTKDDIRNDNASVPVRLRSACEGMESE